MVGVQAGEVGCKTMPSSLQIVAEVILMYFLICHTNEDGEIIMLFYQGVEERIFEARAGIVGRPRSPMVGISVTDARFCP